MTDRRYKWEDELSTPPLSGIRNESKDWMDQVEQRIAEKRKKHTFKRFAPLAASVGVAALAFGIFLSNISHTNGPDAIKAPNAPTANNNAKVPASNQGQKADDRKKLQDTNSAANFALFTYEQVKRLLTAQGLELMPSVKDGAPNFNGVLPSMFSISYPTEDTNRAEYVYIYIYKDVQAREKGYEDLLSYEKRADMATEPIVWGKSNALVLYWHQPVEQNKKTAFEDEISKALPGWARL